MVSLKFKQIGLTGGVASGKSSVAELFRNAGISVINLDEVGRELTDQQPAVQHKLGQLLGPGVYENGQFNRTKAREALFTDRVKRKAVEEYLHPLILAEFERRAAQAKLNGEKMVICEAALLMETGTDKKLDGLVLVSAPESIRSQRVVDRDRIGAVLAEKMIRTQLRDADRSPEQNTFAIENNGSLADLSFKVSEIIDEWKRRSWLND